MTHMGNKALGKGLSALIKPAPESIKKGKDSESEHSVRYLATDQITPSPHNPRKEFSIKEIQELGASIKEHGVIQPLVVRKSGDRYELIAGERRWRASKEISLSTVPALIRTASDREVVEMGLIENLQRQDLNPIEEATGYHQLALEFSLTQNDIAKRIGKSRASVANAMRLLDLATPIQNYVTQGQLTVGHAKAILGVKEKSHQEDLAEQVVKQRLTVRQTEKAVKNLNTPSPQTAPPSSTSKHIDPHLKYLQDSLCSHFTASVSIKDNGKKGKIELEFEDSEDLQRILDIIGIEDKDVKLP